MVLRPTLHKIGHFGEEKKKKSKRKEKQAAEGQSVLLIVSSELFFCTISFNNLNFLDLTCAGDNFESMTSQTTYNRCSNAR